MSDKVKLFKLQNGEIVIAQLLSEEPEHVNVGHPMRLVIVQQGEQQGIALTMWMPCDPEACKLYRPFLAEADCVEPLAKEYLSKFNGVGLVTPPDKKLVVPG